MKKVVIILASLIFLLLFSAIVHEAMQPKPFRWTTSLQSYDRQPYGSFVFFEQLASIFPNKEVKQLALKDFELYQATDQMLWQTNEYVYDQDTTLYYESFTDNTDYKSFNVICLADFFTIDELNARALLQHAYQGNDVLISAYGASNFLTKYLGVYFENPDLQFKTDEAKNQLFEFELLGEQYEIRPHGRYSKLINVPPTAEVIAEGKNGDILGIKIEIGDGTVTVFSLPIVFTNYYLLKVNSQLAENLTLSLPNEDTKWANYFRGQAKHKERSLMDYIHQQESLTWAFYLLLFSVLIYFALQIRRMQRPVPVIDPPANDALKFVDTISNLYFLKKDHKVMMEKKMTYFLEWVRGKYHLDTNKIDQKFIEKLAIKSGVSEEDVGYVFKTYDQLIKKSELTDLEFIRFHKLLQKFK